VTVWGENVTILVDPAGEWRSYSYENGWGASVIRTTFSHGGRAGFWELAVLHEGEICYDSGLTNPQTFDTLGWLTEENVCEVLSKIRRLPVRECEHVVV